jgi:23S rRNA (cytidine1920-2'-O)/16S rRNA (cytidine1409-2'-O)-methyltransferase
MRLDLVLVERQMAISRQQARAMIMSGEVLVNHLPADKPGMAVVPADLVCLKSAPLAYVSRAGLKLKAALDHFPCDPNGLVCMDVGASTGGFTDCLLQQGARRVYAIDVGYGQLAWKLRQDSRVTVIERTNIRHLARERIPEPIDLATIDVAFISLKIVIPAVLPFLRPAAKILALVKPQFEVGKGQVGKGGIVKDCRQHARVIEDLTGFLEGRGLVCQGVIASPIRGQKGNQEFLLYLNC